MLNQVIIVGRIENMTGDFIKLSVPRTYKNADGIYENDVITCKLNGNLYNAVNEHCKIGDLVGIRGRLETVKNKITIVTEKATFLTNKTEGSEKDE